MAHRLPPRAGHSWPLSSIIWIASWAVCLIPAHAAVTPTGDTDPAPGDGYWTTGGDFDTETWIGKSGNGGLTIDGGSTWLSRYGNLGGAPGTLGSVVVSGVGSSWEGLIGLNVGVSGTGQLEINDGGYVEFYVSIGEWAGSSGSVTVRGNDSILMARGFLEVGTRGMGRLVVEDGGLVTGGNTGDPGSNFGTIGTYAGSNGEAIIRGEGSTWEALSLAAGFDGTGSLLIEAGGTARSVNGYIGYNPGSRGSVKITGVGSAWENSNLFYVGDDGNAELMIEDGGTLTSSRAIIGDRAGITGNVTVHGEDSSWTNQGEMLIGVAGTGIMVIEDGGVVSTHHGRLGATAGGSGSMVVTGAGSTFSSSGDLSVGHYLSTGSLTIQDQGVVDVGDRFQVHSDSFVVFADGRLNAGELQVDAANLSGTGTIHTRGISGEGYSMNFDGSSVSNTVLTNGGQDHLHLNVTADEAKPLRGNISVQNGATIHSSTGAIGYGFGSTETGRVAGPGSSWSITQDFRVGRAGAGHLVIEDGGVVNNRQGDVGSHTTTESSVIVRGEGSQWNNSLNLSIGATGNGHLLVTEGGHVSNRHGTAGLAPGSHGSISIIGPESVWTNQGSLWIGQHGSGTLSIKDGANVTSSAGLIAFDGASRGDVMVAGTGSSWIMTGGVSIGYYGAASLTIKDGGSVISHEDATLGSGLHYYGTRGSPGVAYYGKADVVISGANSSWKHDGDMLIGHLGRADVTIADGGTLSVGGDITVRGPDFGFGDPLLGRVNLHVDGNDIVNAGVSGTGNFINNDIVNLFATATLAAGIYTPITVGATSGAFLGNGTYNAFGGSFDPSTGAFTVNAIVDATGGLTEHDLSGGRFSFNAGALLAVFDQATGFGAFNATELGTGQINGEAVVADYVFDTNLSGADVLLYFNLGKKFDLADLSVWHSVAGSEWELITPDAFTYIDGWAGFAVSYFSQYAITAVPEPATYALFIGAMALAYRLLRRSSRTDIGYRM